jgi:hypothetical protein
MTNSENFECKINSDLISIKCKKCNETIAIFGPAGSTEEMKKEEIEHSRFCLDQVLNTQPEA